MPAPSQIDRLLEYLALLHEWAPRTNLTAHRSPEAIVRRVLLDAAALAAQLDPVESLADIGSGAGLPGIPIAILWPGCHVTLVEPRLKRHHFQRAVVRDLGLDNVELIHGRSEQLESPPHAAVVGQALAAPGQALDWLVPWGAVGGSIWLPGSAEPAPVPDRPDLEFVARHHYRVPLDGSSRTLWVGRKTR